MGDVRRLDEDRAGEVAVTLDDLAREGARRMIAAALEAEVEEYVGALVEEVDEDGRRLVVRNGRARERKLTVGSGTVAIRAPRVNDKRVDAASGEREKFSSKILGAPRVIRGDQRSRFPSMQQFGGSGAGQETRTGSDVGWRVF